MALTAEQYKAKLALADSGPGYYAPAPWSPPPAVRALAFSRDEAFDRFSSQYHAQLREIEQAHRRRTEDRMSTSPRLSYEVSGRSQRLNPDHLERSEFSNKYPIMSS